MRGQKRLLWVTAVFGVFLFHCSSTTDSATDTAATTTETATLTTNLETVSDDIAPDSLNYTQNSASVSVAKVGGAGPCVNADDLFDCQPILLQLYIDLGKNLLDTVITIISDVGTNLGDLADGASGTVTEGTTTITYQKTSATDFSIIVAINGVNAGYVNVNGTTYTVKFDLANLPDEESGGNAMQFQAIVSYTDENTWDADFLVAGMECEPSDVQAPERIAIKVEKANGLWAGKAMLYSPRWRAGDSATCDTTVTDDTTINFYTDFVGNNTAAKASVYMMDRSISSLDNIATYGMDSFSTNYGAGFGDTTAYANPFCNPAGTLDALWDDDCTALDATVGAANFSDASNWILPSDYYLETITIPDSL